MAQIKIPDALKADMPQSNWGKVLAATPVIMTVIATLLAGLASSEMTRAQYDRSLAAQQQNKASDEWGFFQAKRLRGAFQSTRSISCNRSLPCRPWTPTCSGRRRKTPGWRRRPGPPC